MYVFLPSTIPALARLLEEGRLEGAALTAFAADPEPSEEAEYEALHAAAGESLALLAADPDAPRRRVVLAADMPDRVVERQERLAEGVARVRITGTVPYKKLVSAHVDDDEAAEDIADAVRDPSSAATDGHELMWFAVQELRHLLGEDPPARP